ncbi:MAG TPA: FtsX-like permease family protein [Candidatus Solibacter sp.]|nr:FtsX-like permease family protein [Candidatus Solibacter sp.]
MTGKLVFENLKHRPMRTLLSILLIGVPVTLILCLVGISHGFIRDSQRRARNVGADILIRPKGSTMLTLGYSMPIELVDKYFAKQPHVQIATGVLNATVEGVTLGMTGLDLPVFDKMSGGFRYIHGGPFQTPDDVIVDDYYADQKKLKVGDHIKLLNHDWRVCGIMESGMLTHIAVPLTTMQEAKGDQGKVSQIYLKLDDPKLTNDEVAYLQKLPPIEDYPIINMADYTSALNVNNIPSLKAFTYVMMGIGVVIGFAVVCLSMYMAVLQRTREIGILKSMGGSKGFILGIILVEAAMLGVGGSILGIIMSYGAYYLIHTLVPASFPMIIVYEWWPIASGITLAATILGAMYPGMSAAAHDPIEALAYE